MRHRHREKLNEDDEATLVKYFLRELSGRTLYKINKRLFLDDMYSNRGDEVERALVDAYVENTLSPEQRSHFETQYLVTTERRKAVESAYALKDQRARMAKPEGEKCNPEKEGDDWASKIERGKERERE